MLPRSARLRSSKDFKRVYARGRSYVDPMAVLYALNTREPGRRIGFSVSKKLGGSVDRNRIKRRLREACKSLLLELRPGFDAVIVGRSRIKEASKDSVREVLAALFERARLKETVGAPEEPPCGDSLSE